MIRRLIRPILCGALLGAASPLPAVPLRVGFETALPPFSSVDAAGQPVGFAPEYVRAVAREAGVEVEFVIGPWNQIFDEFKAGRIDVIGNLVSSAERREFIDFTLPHVSMNAAVFTGAGAAPVQDTADLAGRRLAVPRGSFTHEYVQAHGGWGAIIVPVDSVESGLRDLDGGRCDAMVTVRLIALHLIREHGLQRAVPTDFVLPGLSYKYHMGVRRGNRDLLAQLNEAQLTTHQNGTYARLYGKWIGPLEPRRLGWSDLRPYALRAALALLAVLGAFAWQRRQLARSKAQAEALSRSEERLRESEALLQRSAQFLAQTQRAARIGGWEIDLRTNRLHWTEETHRIHETDASAFTPEVAAALNFYAPASRPLLTAALDRVRADNTPFDLELDLVTARGRTIRVATTGRATLEAGRPIKIFGSLQDVTERHRADLERAALERKMLEAQKLESLVVLAGGVAHDFNNLLTAVMGNANLVRFSLPTVAAAHAQLDSIEQATARAAALCQQMLAYAGRASVAIAEIDFDRLVADTLQLLAPSVGKNVVIQVAAGPTLLPVLGATAQVQQIVMNLALNAAEAIGDQAGRLTVRTRGGYFTPTELGGLFPGQALPAGNYALLEVEDTGCGMTPEPQARIFEPFFTTKPSGQGLGLAAVLGVVRSHRGAITVRSAPGAGALFRVALPALATQPRPVVAPPAPEGAWSGSGLVLVVDDDHLIGQVAALLLKKIGFTAVLAKDGVEGVAAFREHAGRLRCVLMDLTMPRMDGFEAHAEMHRLDPTVPVILMSGYSQKLVNLPPEAIHPAGVMAKPFGLKMLRERLAAALGASV